MLSWNCWWILSKKYFQLYLPLSIRSSVLFPLLLTDTNSTTDSFLDAVISAGPFPKHKKKISFRIWVRFYLILILGSFLMASLVEVSSNTFLKVCDLEDDFYVQITFNFKIMDLPCFVFFLFEVLVVMAEMRKKDPTWQNKWNSSCQVEMSGWACTAGHLSFSAEEKQELLGCSLSNL